MLCTRLAFPAVAVLVVSGMSQAAVLVQYDFGADHGTKTLAPASVAAGLAATSISSPSTQAGNTFGPMTPSWDGGGTSKPEWGNHFSMGMWDSHGYSNDAYFEFTLTPDAGQQLNLTSFTFDIGLSDGYYDTVYYVHTSLDGMAQGQHIATKQMLTGPVGGNYAFELDSIDLSAAKYQGLTSAFTIRMYVDAVDWSTGLIADNVTVNGTMSAVPEPAALGMLGVSALGLIRRRRAKR